MIGRIEKYLSRGEARMRSTLIVFIANYIEYSSYSQLLDDGVEYIEACKNSGAGLVVIIVDPVPDRYYCEIVCLFVSFWDVFLLF